MVKISVGGISVEISSNDARAIGTLVNSGFSDISISDDHGLLAKPHTLIPRCSYNVRDETLCIDHSVMEVSIDNLEMVMNAAIATHYASRK